MSSAVVRFAADGRCRLAYVGAGGERVDLAGDYEVDFSKSPAPLSIRNIRRLPHPLHTIIEFTGPDSLRMGSFAPRWRLRPISFDAASATRLRRRRQE